MFHDINKNLCETYKGLDPIKLLDYPAEDVFNLINATVDFNNRREKEKRKTDGTIRRKAGDDWF